MKRQWIVTVVLLVLLIGATVLLQIFPISGDNPIEGEDASNEYEITRADYSITVSKDHSAEVVETITIKFYVKSRGISRFLPTNSGEQYTNINVEEYDVKDGGEVKVEDNDYYVRISPEYVAIYTGDDNYYKFHRGDSVTYKISYKVVPPVRTVSKTNYYMNAIPFGWDTTQSNVSLRVKFPFAIKNAKVYAGRYGIDQETDPSLYTLTEDELYMEIDNLGVFSGVTIDVDMGRKFNVNFSLPGLLAILIVLAVVATVVCIKFFKIKDTTVFPVINAQPPKYDGLDLDPAQVGFLIDNHCEATDITAMIFYFASKGLIQLENTNGGENFTLIKCGEIDPSAPRHQQIIFNGLFKRGDRVTTKQLQNSFYQQIDQAIADIKQGYAKKLFDSDVKKKGILTSALGAVAIAIFAIAMVLRVHISAVLGEFIFTFAVMAAFTAGGYFAGKYVSDHKYKFKQTKIMTTSFVIALVAMLISLVVSYFALGGVMPFYARVIVFVGLAVVGFVGGLISRKTKYYTELLDQITGFKTFLESAEKERLEALLEENPQYYYDILPYANVLGVSDKWEDKFKGLDSVPPPKYYSGSTILSFHVFNRMFHTSFKSYSSAMASRPSSSSHSGGGGHRGHGGGGFGGGGGHRR